MVLGAAALAATAAAAAAGLVPGGSGAAAAALAVALALTVATLLRSWAGGDMDGGLRRAELDRAADAWRMLKDESVIDGFALWDAEERLASYSGFLARYLPDLAGFHRPTTREVIAALIDGGHVAVPEGSSRDAVIERMAQMRTRIPGLREMHMSDGEVFLARTVDLGEGRTSCIFHNITSLKQREAAQRETENRNRLQASLLDQVANAVLAVDGRRRVTYANRAALALFHVDADAMRGLSAETLVGHEPFAAAIGGAAEVEVEANTQAGSRFPAQVAVSPLRDGIGGDGAAVLVVTDLTARKSLDLQLMHSARLATLGEMAASIAHEFNQCLHVIRLSAESIELDAAEGTASTDGLARRSANILAQVDRLTEMVGQMRSTSRRDPGEAKAFRLADALEGAARMVAHTFRVEGVRLVRAWPQGMPFAVRGHRVRLEQVLINLLNNARDAIRERAANDRDGDGSGTVTLDARWQAETGRVVISVRDDGTGIPDELADQIFDPFVTTKSEEHGCGLGLSICRGIVRDMGGALSFRNLMQGAEFVVELPAEDAGGPATPENDDEPLAAGPGRNAGGRRILVVDDEALSAMMAAEFLERQGYRVDTAHDGEQAMVRCHATVYDAVVTDIRMPRMDGREFIRRLADLQPGTPVIVVTGHLRERDAQLGPTVTAVLEKPFQMTDLLRRLGEIEAGHRHIEAIALGG